MKMNKRPWPLVTVHGIRDRIDTNPDFQRPPVWSRGQKQLLVDTILRGYDIPKFYWRQIASHPDKYDVVDGQQRLRAIWGFISGEYKLARDADPINGSAVANLGYEKLPDDLRVHFDTYAIDVIVLEDTDEDEVREMFLRLQNGTSLKAQEKRNAMPGKMRDFVKRLSEHPFFRSVAFANSRFAHDHVAAQMVAIELNGGPCNIKNDNLNKMYQARRDFEERGDKAQKVRRTLDFLQRCFPAKTPELERFNVVSLYLIASDLVEKYAPGGREPDLAEWFISFEQRRREDARRPEDERDAEAVIYHEKISHSTDAMDSIQWRHEYLMKLFLSAVPDIPLKDPKRGFTHEQRLAIFRRDSGTCQVRLRCEGSKCEWDNWHCDHRTAWSTGGQTTVTNGQVACVACNLAKKANAA